MITKTQDRTLSQAFTKWDRATAYGCRIRGIPYNHARQLELKEIWDKTQREIFAGETMPGIGSGAPGMVRSSGDR